jgi:hypothetical protein
MMTFSVSTFTLFCLGYSASGFAPSVIKPTFSTKLYGEYGASSTSFYTTTEKKSSYKSLEDVLSTKCKDEKVRGVITDMLGACAEITEALRTALVTVEGSMNDFGDAQLSVDVSSFIVVESFSLFSSCSCLMDFNLECVLVR